MCRSHVRIRRDLLFIYTGLTFESNFSSRFAHFLLVWLVFSLCIMLFFIIIVLLLWETISRQSWSAQWTWITSICEQISNKFFTRFLPYQLIHVGCIVPNKIKFKKRFILEFTHSTLKSIDINTKYSTMSIFNVK